MIASLRGEVIAIDAAQAIIEVSGVGYSVRMSSKDLNQLHQGREVFVLTTMTMSQDAVALYGFLHKTTQDLFSQLQKVSGIGPKVAMAILSTLSGDELAHAIRENNVTALTRAPGLGKKGAQKIIVELSGSVNLASIISDKDGTNSVNSTSASLDVDANVYQVIQGLVSLGWQQHDAQRAVDQSIADLHIDIPMSSDLVPTVLRHALSRLDRGR
ncbi:Holliday junction branch migration protein RuvA [Alloscardovia theropitheci]|uniref:Holliday junction branch migration complex subunit RuvA n=1 Tax=Alloscardovia theropitheci TaxID=2496842 RepID=A0A4R0QWI9_9BIFI|nr:Holliday junction branch migration protein RuvA [Alloscardovia theropitheci]TCD54777.1 Holliday junction branch migration protein RuvA [Alloscardovia theropitheci]